MRGNLTNYLICGKIKTKKRNAMRKNVIPIYSKILFLIYCMFIGIKSANSAELNNPFPEAYKDTIALTFVRMGIENGSDIIPFNICHFSCPVSG